MKSQTESATVRMAYSPAEYGRAMGVSPATVRRRLKDGSIPSVLLGRRRLIPAGAFAQVARADAFADFGVRLRAVREALADLEPRVSARVDDPADVATVRRLRQEVESLERLQAAWGKSGRAA